MKLDDLLGEYYELEQQLADPAVHADQAQARNLAKRYSQLTPVIAAYRELNQVESDIEAAQELAAEDPSFADEAKQLSAQREELVEIPPHRLGPAARDVVHGARFALRHELDIRSYHVLDIGEVAGGLEVPRL